MASKSKAKRKSNAERARELPKAKRPGANRQSVLRVILALLRGNMWESEVAKQAGVSVRTVYRMVKDAQKAGFNVWKDNDGKFHASY